MNDQSGKNPRRRFRILAGGNEDAFGVLTFFGIKRNDRDCTGLAAEGGKNFRDGFGAVDHVKMSFRPHHFQSKGDPGSQVKLPEIVGKGLAGVGRGHVMFGVRRVGNDMVKAAVGNVGQRAADVTVEIAQVGKAVGGGA